jgi:RNA polymerase sigma factor (sigma-70 family)
MNAEQLPIGVAIASRRDEVAAELFSAHYSRLTGLARTLVDRREEAEEIVQEGFTRLVASFRRLDDIDKAERYLQRTVLNLARSRLRRRQTARRKVHLLDRGDEFASPERRAERDEIESVRAAIRLLPRRQQECVVLRYYFDSSDREIADTLGISAGSVKAHFARARGALSNSLARPLENRS